MESIVRQRRVLNLRMRTSSIQNSVQAPGSSRKRKESHQNLGDTYFNSVYSKLGILLLTKLNSDQTLIEQWIEQEENLLVHCNKILSEFEKQLDERSKTTPDHFSIRTIHSSIYLFLALFLDNGSHLYSCFNISRRSPFNERFPPSSLPWLALSRQCIYPWTHPCGWRHTL